MKKVFTFLLLLFALHSMAAPPTVASYNLTFSNVDGARLGFYFQQGNGANRIVVMRQGSPVQGFPANGTEYNANEAFGTAGTAFTAPDEYVVAKGSSSVTITNLQPGTDYYIAVFEYNGAGSTAEYLVTPLRANRLTAVAPTQPASSLAATDVVGTAATLSWIKGNGGRRMVVIRKNNAVNFTPQDLQRYNVLSYAYNTTNQVNGDNYAVYSDDGTYMRITNLDPNQLYYYTVFEYNGYSNPVYSTGTSGSFTTATGPTIRSNNFGTGYVEGNSFYYGYSAGNGARRLIIASKTHAITATPVNGQTYTANERYGLGQQIAPDEYVVFDGDGTYSIPFRGLEPNINYHFAIFDYDQSAAGYKYYLQNGFAAIGSTSKTPTIIPSGFSLAEVTGASLRINFNQGNGAYFAGLVKEGSAVDFTPQDLTKYRFDYTFGYGQQSGNGNYWTLNGNSNQAYLAGLKAGLTYHIAVYGMNGYEAPVYSATPGVFSFTTPEKPLTQAYNARALFTEGNTLHLGFYLGSGSHRIVIARKAGTVTAVPVDGTVYTANDTLGKGTEIAPGNFVVYSSNSNNVIMKGLEAGTTYYFTVFEYNISGITNKPSYLTTGNQIANATTLSAPSVQMHFSPATSITTQSARIPFTKGNGTERYIIMRQTGISGGIPEQYNRHAGSSFGPYGLIPFDNLGNYTIARGNYADYIDVTNLRPNTTYTVLGYEYKGESGPVYTIPGDSITFTTPEVSNAPTAPTQNAASGIVSKQEGTSLQLQWANGNGTGRIVVMKKGSPVTFRPQNADEYTANTVFAAGTNLGDGQYVVFNGTGNVVQLTNLQPSTTYYYAVYEYNGTGTLTRYLTSTNYAATAPTAYPPSQATTNVRLYQGSTTTSVEFNWTSGNGTNRLIVMREGSPVTFKPTDLTTYTANRQFGMNSVGNGEYMMYNNNGNVVTITGLDMTKTYYFQFFEYNGNTAPVYKMDNNAQGTVTTAVILPVKWVSFTAIKNGSNALLNWMVTDEVNVAGYDIESSADGRTFTAIRQVKAKPVAATNSYQVLIPQTAGTVYYRIRQNDKDGKASYSAIAKVALTNAPLEVKVYPNPATDFISVQLDIANSKSQLSIYTTGGQKVVEKTVTSNTDKITVQQLPAGTYFIVVQNGTQSSKTSFVKQ